MELVILQVRHLERMMKKKTSEPCEVHRYFGIYRKQLYCFWRKAVINNTGQACNKGEVDRKYL